MMQLQIYFPKLSTHFDGFGSANRDNNQEQIPPQEKINIEDKIMLRESLNSAIDYIYSSCEFEMTLELIEDGLNEGIIERDSVIGILNEMAIESDLFLERILQIMEDYSIEISSDLKHRQFTSDIKYRLGEIVRFIHNENLTKVAESRVQGIIYDLEEYLSGISNS